MTAPGPQPSPAEQPRRVKGWQPLSFSGCAALARSKWRRWFVVQFLVSQICAGLIFWVAWHAWVPVIEQGFDQLPEDGRFSQGELRYGGPDVRPLAENRFVGLQLGFEEAESASDVRFGFGRRQIQVCSLLGCYLMPYPRTAQSIPINPIDSRSAWEAWRGMIYTSFWIGTSLALLLSWAGLAFFYSLPLALVAFFTDRDGGWAGCFKMCGAALLPGGLLLTGSLVLYGMGWLDSIRLALMFLLHFVVQWIYAVGGFWRLPKKAEAVAAQKNPFQPTS